MMRALYLSMLTVAAATFASCTNDDVAQNPAHDENTPVQVVESGDTVNLVISGFASPLHNSDYNRHLSSRRIVSLLNWLRKADGGRLSPYITGKIPGLRIETYPEGAVNHAFETDEVRETVFGLRAAKDRRIVIRGS